MTANGDLRAESLARGVAATFRRHVQRDQLARIARCVAMLSHADLWRRPSPNCNSVGNLLLHLAGNVTQWILANFGTLADQRDRPAEFAASEGADSAELLARLTAVVGAACDLVDGLSVDELLRERLVQGRYRETGLTSVLHVLEHFSGHAGQIFAWTKQVTGEDLRFYDL